MRVWTSNVVRRGLLIATVVLAQWAGQPSCARLVAGEGILGPLHRVVLPGAGSRTVGFTTQVQMANETAAGYIPVSITCEAVGTLPADRRLIYRFATRDGGQMPPRNGLVVDVPIDLPQGMKTETFVRYLPKWSAGQAIDLSVIEDGRVLEEYTALISLPMRRGTRSTRELIPSEHEINWVYLGSEDEVSPETMPDLRGILSASYIATLSSYLDLGPITDANALTLWSQNMGGPKLMAIGQKDLPTDWRAYQRYDVVVVNTKGLKRLRANDSALQAVRGWVLSGGTILVYDAPSRDSVLSLLNFRPIDDKELTEQIVSIAAEYTQGLGAAEKQLKETVTYLQQGIRSGELPIDVTSESAVEPPVMVAHLVGDLSGIKEALQISQKRLEQMAKVPRYTPAQWSRQVWMQPAAAGRVLGIKSSDQYAVPPLAHWDIAVDVIGYRASPMLRRGVDPLIGDRRFTKWMIPGVAQPPVYTFMGLLTVFVVLVGPVAYRRTARVGRGYLMFAIAPALALFTTVAMFGYGIVSDGFGTIVRARQLTWVDGRSGDAGERVRTTYFAGVRPGEGLRFPGTAEVIGYPEGTGKSWEGLNELSPATIGKVIIRDVSQVFDSSFLPSRQQRQFVVHSPRQTVGHVQLIPDPEGSPTPMAENGFDFELREAVFRDSRGDYWTVENLAAGEKRLCKALSLKESSEQLGRIYNEHRPLSAVRETKKRQYYRNEIYDVIADTNRQLKTVRTVMEGIFEDWLQRHLQTKGEIPHDHFVATADVSRDVLAVEGSELSASVRYVFGTLR